MLRPGWVSLNINLYHQNHSGYINWIDKMPDVQSHKMNPGDKMNFINQQGKAIRIKIVTADGTEIESNLHPGASLEMTIGNQPANVFLFDSDQKYENFEIV